MHRLLIWLLLALTPFTGVRMVCVDRPAPPEAAAVDVAAEADCDQFCLRPSARSPEGAHADVDCVLFADGAVFMVVSGVAVLPAQTPISYALQSRSYELEVSDFYLPPALSHHSPPPKA